MKRCPHGIYLPEGQKKSHGCQGCFPLGHKSGRVPKFKRRNSLVLTNTGKLPKCPICRIPVAVSEGKCIECGTVFEFKDQNNLRANIHRPGICPECGSGVHFETKNKQIWICADCKKEYDAPRIAYE